MNRRVWPSLLVAAVCGAGLAAAASAPARGATPIATWSSAQTLQTATPYFDSDSYVTAVVATPDGGAVAAWAMGDSSPGLQASRRPAGSAVWQKPAVVDADSSDVSQHYQDGGVALAATPAGEVLAAYPSTSGVKVAALEPGASTWSTPALLSTDLGTGVRLAAGPGGMAAAVWHDDTYVYVAIRASATSSWSDPTVVSGATSGDDAPLNTAPQITIAAGGTVLVVWGAEVPTTFGSGSGYQVTGRSYTEAQGWTAPVELSGSSDNAEAADLVTGSDDSAALLVDPVGSPTGTSSVRIWRPGEWGPAHTLGAFDAGPLVATSDAGYAITWTTDNTSGQPTGNEDQSYDPSAGWTTDQPLAAAGGAGVSLVSSGGTPTALWQSCAPTSASATGITCQMRSATLAPDGSWSAASSFGPMLQDGEPFSAAGFSDGTVSIVLNDDIHDGAQRTEGVFSLVAMTHLGSVSAVRTALLVSHAPPPRTPSRRRFGTHPG